MSRPAAVSDMDRLVPSFRVRVETLVERLTREGHKPKVFETFRTAERGRWLERKGASKNGDRSMHRYGIAADIICRQHGWRCQKHGCDFFERLGMHAKRLALTWGGDWTWDGVRDWDSAHVQAIPLSMQNRFREIARPLDEADDETELIWV